jgi:membrane protein implicated in regulation of membrane protease activity
MRMVPGLIWGVLLVLIGLAAIFRVVFNVNLFGVLFGLFLIFMGVTLLLGKPWMFHHHRKDDKNTMFEDRTVFEQPRDNSEYNVIFGRSVYDFRNVKSPNNEPIKVKINTVFGNSVIKINKNTPVKIKSDAVFAASMMPDGNSVAFGSIQYTTDTFATAITHLYIDAPVVFGAIEVRVEE